MNINHPYFEQIELYLDGELPPGEARELEARIAADPDLAAQLALQKEIKATLSDREALALEESLLSIRNNQKKNKAAGIRPLWKRPGAYGIAATFLFLILGGWWWFNYQNAPDQLYDRYFDPGFLDLTEMSNEQDYLSEGGDYYNSGNYIQAFERFDAYLQENPDSPQAYLYAGRSALAAADYDMAVVLLTFALEQPSLFQDEARWHLALARLKQGNIEECRSFLQLLSEDEDADFHQEARELLERLPEPENLPEKE